MTTAITGESTSATSGTAIASARIRRAMTRVTTTCGDDSRTTGSSVMLPIAHNDTIAAPAAIAAMTGNRSGAANAISARRRSPAGGQAVSLMAAHDGRAAASAMSAGAAA